MTTVRAAPITSVERNELFETLTQFLSQQESVLEKKLEEAGRSLKITTVPPEELRRLTEGNVCARAKYQCFPSRLPVIELNPYFMIAPGMHSGFPNGLRIISCDSLEVEDDFKLPTIMRAPGLDCLMVERPYDASWIRRFLLINLDRNEELLPKVRDYTLVKMMAAAQTAYHKLGLAQTPREEHLLFYRPVRAAAPRLQEYLKIAPDSPAL